MSHATRGIVSLFLLGSLFLGTAPPAAPGPAACGPDPTGDELPECRYAPELRGD
jgi:hypothetical protein